MRVHPSATLRVSHWTTPRPQLHMQSAPQGQARLAASVWTLRSLPIYSFILLPLDRTQAGGVIVVIKAVMVVSRECGIPYWSCSNWFLDPKVGKAVMTR